MKIAITSQNKHSVTGHAGKCRKFWVYQIVDGKTSSKELLELPMEQSFHASSPQEPHPLDEIQVLITGGMGEGLRRRMAVKNIQAVVTEETDLDKAVEQFLAN
ncbi:MAG: nitrogen fixation protein [Magnetococcales bacterium]|nr:nitrogen fixation protein [Magnetococcales bacterium]